MTVEAKLKELGIITKENETSIFDYSIYVDHPSQLDDNLNISLYVRISFGTCIKEADTNTKEVIFPFTLVEDNIKLDKVK
jgi:hypothetical protein